MTKNRHQALGLTDEDVMKMYEMMVMSRKIDERLWLLNRAGKINFAVSCQGQEAAQVGAAFALDREQDYVLPYYRDMGVVLTFGMTARDLMLFSYGKYEDPNSGGRQMPGHYGQKKNRIVTGSSPVTTQVPHAVGIALAGKMKKENFVTFVTFGEGSSNQGDFHEGANFAAVHKLPVILMCENNKYAISVPYNKQVACVNISDRAIGYGMPGVTVDGNDPLEVFASVKEAADRGRRGEGPTLIEALCYRFTPHSSDDDDLVYRKEMEVKEAKNNDPITLFANYLKEIGLLTTEKEEKIVRETMDIIDEATEYAEAAPYPEPEQALQYVYAE